MNKLLSLHYLPNVLWMSHFITNNCILDVHEHYIKQSYRNRCVILSANGPLTLTIPVKKSGHKTPIHQVQTDPTVFWQRQHWESIKAAYGSSPYYIHYAPYFEPLYAKEVSSLMTFEMELLHLVIKLLKIELKPIISEFYQEIAEQHDFRNKISPKIPTEETFIPYLQVFTEKINFVPNLSILDLLFNQGPRALNYLLKFD